MDSSLTEVKLLFGLLVYHGQRSHASFFTIGLRIMPTSRTLEIVLPCFIRRAHPGTSSLFCDRAPPTAKNVFLNLASRSLRQFLNKRHVVRRLEVRQL